MAGGSQDVNKSSSSGLPTRKKRYDWGPDGKLAEVWVDVPAKKPKKKGKTGGNPVELFKEFKFDEDISLGRIFPSLQGTRFDALVMKQTRMVWLARDVSARKKAGLWLETDIEFRGIFQPLHDILRDVFAQEHPGLHLEAHLGIEKDWSDDLIATGFTLKGSVDGINRGFGEFLTFRNAGVMLNIAPGKDGNLDTLWGFFGTLHLAVPNSVVPLVLEYKLEPKSDTLDISMTFGEGEKWGSVFGVKGLDLDDVTFNTTVVKSGLDKTLEFSVVSKWNIGGVPVELSGHIKKSGSSLRGYIKTLTMDDLRRLFNTMTGSNLDPVEQDVRFSELTIEISEGRFMFYGEVWVDSYKVAAAEVLVSVDGVMISGAVDDLAIGEELHVKKARLELIIGNVDRPKTESKGKAAASGNTKESAVDSPPKDASKAETPSSQQPPVKKKGTPVAAIIRGEVHFDTDTFNLTFNVAAALTKTADGPLDYFIYGQLDCENFSIGKMIGGAMDEGHPMDLQLDRVTLIAASKDIPNDYGLNTARFPIKQGVFLCAELKSVPFVGDLCKGSSPEDRYVLRAGYSKGSGLSISIILPETTRIELSPTVVSGPLTLIVETQPDLRVLFQATLWVTPDGQSEPLQLDLGVSANSLQAAAYAQMLGEWKNPLGLSPRLTIGPLALEVEIIYEQFLATGTPSGIGFEGGFSVAGSSPEDETDRYEVAFNLGTNPKETLVKVKATRLESSQIINLVNAVAELDIDKPEREIIRFEDVNVYASPLGCIIGTRVFPPGFVVQGKAFILDKKVEIDCRVGSEGLKLKGEVEGFQLGPLKVRGGKRVDGTQAENALIDFEITKQRQYFEVSGSVALWDLEASVFVKAQIVPDPELEFNFELGWSNLLRFQVDGKLIKPEAPSLEDGQGKNAVAEKTDAGQLVNLEDCDFQLHAVLEQRILTEISEAMQKWFSSAQASVHEGIDEAKRKVDEAKLAFEQACEAAKQEVAKTRAKFDAAMEDAQAGLREKEEECRQARLANERYIIEEERRADEHIQAAIGDLNGKQKAFEDDMEEKKRDLAQKQRDGDDAINGSVRELQGARESLQRGFGDAIGALESAQARVNAEEWRVKEAQDRLDEAVDDLDDCYFWEAPYYACKVAVLGAEVLILKAALGAAWLILEGARFIVEGVAYNIALGAVNLAQGALEAARVLWAGIIAAAQLALDGVVAVHAAGIEIAKGAVIVAEKVALGIKQAAAATMDVLLAAQQGILSAARAVVKAVAEGIDFIAFQTALAALDFAQKNTTWVDLAKGALDAAEAVAQAALAAAKWLAERLCDTLNIELVEITGSLKTITEGKPFTIRVKGVILGERFDFSATWSPKDILGFIVGLCKELWDKFMENVVELFAASK
ncbi:hypothetical protein OQA88_10929 [Cercophora sp. LCS_1]